MIVFRLSWQEAVEDKPETPAPKFDIRNSGPSHLDTFQFPRVLKNKNYVIFMMTFVDKIKPVYNYYHDWDQNREQCNDLVVALRSRLCEFNMGP